MSKENKKIILNGFNTLEGPFLEKIWAAYLLKIGKNVVERYETGGYHHDVLVKEYSQSILYECTGQKEMTEQKINKLRADTFKIAKEIEKMGEPPLKKVILVSATARNSWKPKVIETFNNARDDLREHGFELQKIEDNDILYCLVKEGILGFRLIQNRLYPVGPEDYGIRFDKERRIFVYDKCKINMTEFKRLPQSFLPSLYWGTYYRELVEECMDPSEGKSYSFWETYSFGGFGITWKSTEDLAYLYNIYDRRHDREWTTEIYEGVGYIHEWKSRRRNYYYSARIFDTSPYITRDKIAEILGKLMEMVHSFRKNREYLKDKSFSYKIITSSEDWSPRAWWEARISAREDLWSSEIKRGTEVYLDLLNSGLIGITYLYLYDKYNSEPNHIKFVGPNIPAIRLKGNELMKEEYDHESE